ncbi:ATP-binding cassette domain-containing protein [Tundrisphaera lichenicola]|uniref:ATP-binding cassette domain-containing protein n=1 Tax=Tundrisphaera lichenicola TaxID=2029860 RepID=UPI003EB6B2ED
MIEPPVYRLRSLGKDYGGRFRLRVGELDVHRGEVVCLLGPTGAGKSTLLRILAGLEPLGDGEAWFEGHSSIARGLDLASRRRISMVFQAPRLLTGSVRFNVEYGLRLRGHRGPSERTSVLMDRLGLTGIADQSARSLSGGQVQLVSLARSLVIGPEILLLDEPTAHLDPAHVALVERTILEDHQVRGTTVVWATHNLFQARRVARRVGLLLDGSLIELATTGTFFENPADPRTAAFVRGEMIY